MNTANEQLIQTVKDNIACNLMDYGVTAGEAYDLAHIDFDPLEIMDNVNLESAQF
jgi:hypothetical protein